MKHDANKCLRKSSDYNIIKMKINDFAFCQVTKTLSRDNLYKNLIIFTSIFSKVLIDVLIKEICNYLLS